MWDQRLSVAFQSWTILIVTTSKAEACGLRNHHAIKQVWRKEEEELEEEEKNQGRFSVIIDSSLLRWCQKIQSAQQMLLKAICKGQKKVNSNDGIVASTSTDIVPRKSNETVARISTDTVAEIGSYCSCDTVAGLLQQSLIQGRRVDIPASIDDNMPLSVDRASRISIDRHLTVSIDRHLTVSIDAHHQRASLKGISL
ncbi:hypothetical protein DY000_02039840 [Brassica cretica]|uniref:Uncharacterized protein n=1 Tax=Brassica cretica TaxID=69181 RepID=A0ABQ7BEA2_BRACR|nr:hypothetical protein DY000_02039840 [Brassica cretica]